MDYDRQFFYAQLVAFAFVGLFAWLAFAHWWIADSIIGAIVGCGVLFLRYRGLEQWSGIQRRGKKREIAEFKVFLVLVFLFMLGLAITLHFSSR